MVQNVEKAVQVHDGRCLLVPLVVPAALVALVALVAPAVQAGLPMSHRAWNLLVLLRFPDLRAGRMAVPSKAQDPE